MKQSDLLKEKNDSQHIFHSILNFIWFKLKIRLMKNFNLYNFPVKVGILLSDSL